MKAEIYFLGRKKYIVYYYYYYYYYYYCFVLNSLNVFREENCLLI